VALVDAARTIDEYMAATSDTRAPVSGGADAPNESEQLSPIVAELVHLADRATAAELDTSYQELFGHTVRGRVPPFETEYGAEALFRQTQELADIAGFYHAFGLEVSGTKHERTDHFAVEFEFLAFLSRKQAILLDDGEHSKSREVEDAERLFLRDHLGRIGRAFALALMKAAERGFYETVGRLCGAILATNCILFDLTPGPAYVRLRSAEDAEVPTACGSCDLAGNQPITAEES
jgi:TorA maturation chaperone TorD